MVGIGVAASILNVTRHTLYHCEEVGAVVPSRSPSGHRQYSDEDLDGARFVLRGQRAGFSLQQIVALLAAPESDRHKAISQRIDELKAARDEADALAAWMSHRLVCAASEAEQCSECARCAADACPADGAQCSDVTAGGSGSTPL